MTKKGMKAGRRAEEGIRWACCSWASQRDRGAIAERSQLSDHGHHNWGRPLALGLLYLALRQGSGAFGWTVPPAVSELKWQDEFPWAQAGL